MIDYLMQILDIDNTYLTADIYGYLVIGAIVILLTFYILLLRVIVSIINYITKF